MIAWALIVYTVVYTPVSGGPLGVIYGFPSRKACEKAGAAVVKSMPAGAGFTCAMEKT